MFGINQLKRRVSRLEEQNTILLKHTETLYKMLESLAEGFKSSVNGIVANTDMIKTLANLGKDQSTAMENILNALADATERATMAKTEQKKETIQ